MNTPFISPGWHTAIARLVQSGGEEVAAALINAVSAVVNHQGTCLIAFHRHAPPDILHHTLEPAGAKHYLDRYLAGPYLLDPLYQLALSERKPGICRYRDQTPDRFRSSEYYRRYSERTHLVDEMDFLLDVGGESTLVLVVGRREKRFSKAEISRLGDIEPIVHAAMAKIWEYRAPHDAVGQQNRDMHNRLTEVFANFGTSVLTDREREITQLLLRGYSTKAIARQLKIAPGTVMVHKRNLFTKLGITSQYQLFSQFIDALSTRRVHSPD
ncbi:MAG TPA: helix-turn-helix transcriptional regulator [Woeseiaceae bacterium]|nr:helix-turn-helix transcriptional regulator [Woeseiaceae bacterium]